MLFAYLPESVRVDVTPERFKHPTFLRSRTRFLIADLWLLTSFRNPHSAILLLPSSRFPSRSRFSQTFPVPSPRDAPAPLPSAEILYRSPAATSRFRDRPRERRECLPALPVACSALSLREDPHRVAS